MTLCDEPSAPPGEHVMTFDVPGGVPHHRARIEAVFEPSRAARRLDVPDPRYSDAHRVADPRDRSCAWAERWQAQPVDGAAPLIGSSAAITAVRDRIERVAATDFTVLIEGESGTGKELVARQIHEISRRHKGPFVAVNCAAIVETLLEAELFGIEERTATGVRGRRGKFEHAHEGTLFLDEVADLSPAAQAKLLRAIQDLAVERVGGAGSRRVDTRIIVATNQPLAGLVELRPLSSRPVLPAAWRRSAGAAAACAARGHRGAGALFSGAPPIRAPPAVVEGRGRRAPRLRLAGQCPRARACHRARRGVGRFGLPGARRPAVAAVGRLFRCPRAVDESAGESMRAWQSRYARLVYERCDNNKRQACRELGISYHTLRAHLAFRPERAQR